MLLSRTTIVLICTVLLLCSLVSCVCSSQVDLRFRDRIQKGEDALRSLQGRAKASPCWLNALKTLIDSCKSMDEILRSKFAVQLANCHLQSSGLSTFPCTEKMSVLECTEPLAANAIAFNTYTEFFIHADHICYYIESENLQQRMENSVDELLRASTQVASDVLKISVGLNTIETRQTQIIEGQQTIQNLQQQFAEQATTHMNSIHVKADQMARGLEETLAVSSTLRDTQSQVITQLVDVQSRQRSISEVLHETRSAQDQLREEQKRFSAEQSRMHSDVSSRVEEILGKTQSASSTLQDLIQLQSKSFSEALGTVEQLSREAQHAQRLQASFIQSLEKVISLQEFLLGEVFDLKAVAFYVGSILLAFLFTSCDRLSAARFWLFLLMSGSFVLERVIVRYYFNVESISSSLWICRKLTCLCALAVLAVFALRYKDTAAKLLSMMDSHDSTLQYLRLKEDQRSVVLSELVAAQKRLLERSDLLEMQSSRPGTKTRVRV